MFWSQPKSYTRGMAAGWTYVRPETLRVPTRPPKLVYLDLNHWVSLAKANSNHRQAAQFSDALLACLEAVRTGAALFPISASTYMETTKIRQRRHREDLRRVIEQVSGFWAIAPRVVVEAHEVEALLDRLFGPNPNPIAATDYLGWGFAHAHGKGGGAGPDRVGEPKRQQAEIDVCRWALDGPTSEEEALLPRFGYNPLATHQVQVERAAEEQAQVERFNANPTWRDQRIRTVVRTREVRIEIWEMLGRGLLARGVDPETALDKLGPGLDAADWMPSLDVAVSLKTAYHRNPLHRWKPNDIQDIDALAEALPYCDIVVTDKAEAGHLAATGVAGRIGASVLSRLSRLVDLL
jgi:hypothetical protein